MECKSCENCIILRLDKGDEIVASMEKACAGQPVRYAHFSGIGACRKAEIAHFDTREKKYHSKKLEGTLEILSLSGNITIADGRPFVHAHIVLGLPDFSVQGGHLVSAEVNPTCEIVLRPLPADVKRRLDERCGLKLQQF